MSQDIAPSKEAFIKAADKAFDYLIRDYGFLREPLPAGEREVWVAYATGTVRIVVQGRDWGLNTRVALGRTGDPDAFENYDLDDLLAVRAVAQREKPGRGSIAQGSRQLEQLRYYASILREIAPDILRGDLTVFALLQERADNRARLFHGGE